MKKILFILSALAFVLSPASCSLVEDTSDVVSPYGFYKTKAQIRAAVNGCYDPLNYIHNMKYFIALEGSTDLASTNGSAQQDARFEINPASPGAATIVWNRCWIGIRYCISTIAGIKRSDLSYSEKAPYEVEARILMSYYYYVLTSFFGDVPFYEDYLESEADMQRITRMGRMSAVNTRNTLIDELKNYVPLLPQVRTCDQEFNYCGAAMGWMLIAKMAAWNKDWDNVIYACEHLENIYGELEQYPYIDVCFRNKNTPESIFEINHEYVEGGVEYTTWSGMAISDIILPKKSESEKGTDLFDGVHIPEVGDRAYAYTPVRPSSYMKTTIAPSGTDDVRREINMATGWNGQRFGGGRTWMGQKFWCFNVYRNYDSNNYKIFRYADALLLLAEAWCEKGDYSRSVDYLNTVRSRAKISPYNFVGEIKLRGEIRDERARELFGEWGRKYDLVRWGIWYEQVYAYNTYDKAREYIRPCHQYYPIPDVQCQRSGGSLSNPEYDKYNLSNED